MTQGVNESVLDFIYKNKQKIVIPFFHIKHYPFPCGIGPFGPG
jgi:hypothetical protein